MKFLQILVLILVFVIVGDAQNTILTGTIYDSNGAVILGTEIKIIDRTGKEYKTQPNDSGVYEVSLPREIYQIEFQAVGFKSLNVQKYRIVPSYTRKMHFDVVLEVGEPSSPYAPVYEDLQFIKAQKSKLTNKVSLKPLGKILKKQNKIKRKNKSNK